MDDIAGGCKVSQVGKRGGAWKWIAAALVFVVLSGCGDVRKLKPLNKKVPAEECAVLVIPRSVVVKRIDGKKKSWGVGAAERAYPTSKTKASTLLVPAGEHTIVFDYLNWQHGLVAKKLESSVTMTAGKRYVVSVKLDGKADVGFVSSVFNIATSMVRNVLVGLAPFNSWYPCPTPEGITYQINETFEEYPIEHISAIVQLLALIIVLAWTLIIRLLAEMAHGIFMGRLRNSHPFVTFILTIGLLISVALTMSYNTSGLISLYLLSTFIAGIGVCGCIRFGSKYNKAGWNVLNGEEASKGITDPTSSGNIGASLTGDFSTIADGDTTGISYFNLAIAAAPYNASYRNNRGLAYHRLGIWTKAIADFDDAARLKPKNKNYQNNLAHARKDAQAQIPNSSGFEKFKSKDYNGAISDFTTAIKIAPHNAGYIADRGMTYYHLQDYGKSIADLSEAIRLSPNNSCNARYIANRGMAYHHLQDYEKSIADLSEAIRLEAKNSLQGYDKSILLSEAIRLNPKNSRIKNPIVAQALALHTAHDDSQCIAEYGARITAFYQLQDYEKFIAELSEAIRLDPTNKAVYIAQRGIAYYHRQDYENATTDLNEAVRLDPNNKEYKQLHLKAKRTDDARRSG